MELSEKQVEHAVAMAMKRVEAVQADADSGLEPREAIQLAAERLVEEESLEAAAEFLRELADEIEEAAFDDDDDDDDLDARSFGVRQPR